MIPPTFPNYSPRSNGEILVHQNLAVCRTGQPLQPTSQVSPAIMLPRLKSPDQRFMHLKPDLAGNAVLLRLYPPNGSTRAVIRRAHNRTLRAFSAWSNRTLGDLGRAAQALEGAGYNWREASNYEAIFTEHRELRNARSTATS
jgi:hypothetical protein